jgi:hypothetical protein
MEFWPGSDHGTYSAGCAASFKPIDLNHFQPKVVKGKTTNLNERGEGLHEKDMFHNLYLTSDILR